MDDFDLVTYTVLGVCAVAWIGLTLYERWHRRKYGYRVGMRP